MALDVDRYDALTFDCFGTLIDWATGIPNALQPILASHEVDIEDDRLFALYARYEKEIEGATYVKYREVLRRVVQRFGNRFRFSPTNAEMERFARSVGQWPPFSDTNEALTRLRDAFRIAVVSNVDTDLFQESAQHFSVPFDEVILAEHAGAYKPDLAPFEMAFTRIGVPPNRVLHVAQSVYHDVNPAQRLGLSCAWVRRYGDRFDTRSPATEPAFTVSNLTELADTLLS